MKKTTLLILFSFLVVAVQAQISITSTPNADIPDNAPGTPLTDVINVSGATGSITDVTVDVTINHTWVGDVTVTLTAPDGTTTADILVEPGDPDGTGFGCSNNNINATFSDAGALTAENECQVSAWEEGVDPPGTETYAISGTWQAGDQAGAAVDLSAIFSAVGDANGNWTLSVSDSATGDTGDLEAWTLNVSGPTLSIANVDEITGLSLSPNPVKDVLNLRAGSNIDAIQVFNIIGQEVLRSAPAADMTKLNMSELQSGAYFVRVTVGEVTQTSKIIKQ